VFLDLAEREVAVVPAGRGEDRVGPSVGERLREMRRCAGAARGDHRHGDGTGDRAEQVEVVAFAGAVAVHRRDQDLAGAVPGRRVGRPFDRVPPCAGVAGVDVHLPPVVAPLRVDGDDHALGAEAVGGASEQRRIPHGGAVHAHLVRSCPQQRLHVVLGPDPTADREGDEDLLRGAGDDVQRGGAILEGRRDVEEHQLVGALTVVVRGELDGVARVSKLLEPHALHHAAGVDVQARDHAFGEHRRITPSSPATASASSRTALSR
jgi:hypothetical protein